MSTLAVRPAAIPVNVSFTRYAWAVLVCNIFVVLWGALVRATGSGAGCGEHWPLCNGQVVPVLPQLHTVIEFTHRVTSGLALIGVVALYVWARRSSKEGSPLRKAALFALAFMIVEALIGAVLVKFGLVAGSRSPWRAVVLAVHLVNTLMLLGSLTLAAWWSQHEAGRWVRSSMRNHLLLALLAAVVTTAAGGVAALGDTLFPSQSVAQGMSDDFSLSAPLLMKLRVLHPIAAVLSGVFLIWLSLRIQSRFQNPDVQRWSNGVLLLTIGQFAIGILNIFLLTPLWTQILHLLVADLLWVCLVLTAASSITVGSLLASD